MKTKRAISCIGYHSSSVFESVTNDLRKSGVIGPCFWICHKGEGGDKDHIHLLLLDGFKVYNTDGLSSLWGVDIVDGKSQSLSSRWRVTANVSDWLLYSVHNLQYMAFKGLLRENNYTWDDIKCSSGDEDLRNELILDANEYLSNFGDKTTRRLILFAKEGKAWKDVIMSGLVPMGQYNQAYRAWYLIQTQISPSFRKSRTIKNDSQKCKKVLQKCENGNEN